jgi:RTX calcium-binding nonapeptide repeat (4 copies)
MPWLGFVVVSIVVLWSSPAHAAVTIGSDMTAPVDSTITCGIGDGNCTSVQTALPGRLVSSPMDGVVVRFRLKTASSPGPVQIRVVRPGASGSFTGAGTVEVAPRECPDVCVEEIRLPIKAGDYIGVNAPAGARGGYRNVGGATLAVWSPFLGDGESRPPDQIFGGLELVRNADIEPDADADAFGDETQDLCASTPNSGSLAPCAPPTISGTARNGSTLTVEGHATGTPASETFQWLRCDSGGSACEPIESTPSPSQAAEGSAYVLTTLDIGHAIKVSQTLTTVSGTATSVSAATQPVAPLPGRCTNRRSGTAARDRLTGTSGGDRLNGLAGKDTMKGGRGADCLLGRGGGDRLVGGPGRDRLVGGPGRDVLSGGPGRDVLSGGPGRDVCRGDERDRFRSCERILG